jgi:hypothetical protein
MDRVEKKHLKRMNCPQCHRPKLRYEHSVDGVQPDGGNGPQRKLRCDVCKINFMEGDAPIQAELRQVLADMTPPPIAIR